MTTSPSPAKRKTRKLRIYDQPEPTETAEPPAAETKAPPSLDGWAGLLPPYNDDGAKAVLHLEDIAMSAELSIRLTPAEIPTVRLNLVLDTVGPEGQNFVSLVAMGWEPNRLFTSHAFLFRGSRFLLQELSQDPDYLEHSTTDFEAPQRVQASVTTIATFEALDAIGTFNWMRSNAHR